MRWKVRTILLILILSPSFIGYPIININTHFIFGWAIEAKAMPSDGQVLYFLLVLLSVLLISGYRVLFIGIETAAIVSISILFAGGAIAFLRMKIAGAPDFSPYYLGLYINILTVVPISIAFFMSVPFLQFESSILSSIGGVSRRQKAFLMMVRMVTHIIYSVIPDIITVLKEERQAKENIKWTSLIDDASQGKVEKILKTIKSFLYISVSCIAKSIEYIPLWTVEILKLPAR